MAEELNLGSFEMAQQGGVVNAPRGVRIDKLNPNRPTEWGHWCAENCGCGGLSLISTVFSSSSTWIVWP